MEHITEEWISKEKVRLTNEIDRLAHDIKIMQWEKEMCENMLRNYSERSIEDIIWHENMAKEVEKRLLNLSK